MIFGEQNKNKGVQVRFEDGDLRLTQKAIAELYDCTADNVSLHPRTYIRRSNLIKRQQPRISRQFKSKETVK